MNVKEFVAEEPDDRGAVSYCPLSAFRVLSGTNEQVAQVQNYRAGSILEFLRCIVVAGTRDSCVVSLLPMINHFPAFSWIIATGPCSAITDPMLGNSAKITLHKHVALTNLH